MASTLYIFMLLILHVPRTSVHALQPRRRLLRQSWNLSYEYAAHSRNIYPHLEGFRHILSTNLNIINTWNQPDDKADRPTLFLLTAPMQAGSV
ncbi:uncharacterized protein F5891DRAFT_737569 [Suillus fuscotomentosus]|uniref:Uncharacterized protein n=1 Tax=Suillus fuscotomentosus TaxID=1912939 RepID=A0AAD4DWB3_9AGAM|nr:uncharacterized protein F5891DRAFT_737569 [Suillus fuscotomentosus]KAG1894079.1 hypothetical protein F5891DRAFT_737569 [Suillus fuscotomentosus]